MHKFSYELSLAHSASIVDHERCVGFFLESCVADEIVNVLEILLSSSGAWISAVLELHGYMEVRYP